MRRGGSLAPSVRGTDTRRRPSRDAVPNDPQPEDKTFVLHAPFLGEGADSSKAGALGISGAFDQSPCSLDVVIEAA